jgi:ABC-type dipeptide/oligopeptide/nickel transport system permease component
MRRAREAGAPQTYSRKERRRKPVLTFIARRILYSIPVLILSTFLSFVFVSLAGDPVALLRGNPRISQNTIHLVEVHNDLNR